MFNGHFTVNTLLGLPNKEFCDKVLAVGRRSEDTAILKGRVAKALRGLQWKVVEGQIRRKVAQLLDIDVMGLIASAWRQGKIMEQLDEETRDKGGISILPLDEHNIRSEMEPQIEIVFGNFVQRIVLNVVVEIKLTGLVLSLEDSTIKAIEAGSMEGVGKITIADAPMLERSFGRIDLQAKLNLGSGIPLSNYRETRKTTAGVPAQAEAISIQQSV